MSPVFPALSGLSTGLWAVSFALLILGVAVSLFWAMGIKRWTAQRAKTLDQWPSLSIIVAGRNEEQFVEKCLKALLQIDYDGQWELIFVDDHSTDQTQTLAKRLAAISDGHLAVVSAPPCPSGMGPKKNAIAYGAASAKGEILLFTDADCLVKRGWAKSIIGSYGPSTGAVTGPVLPPHEPGFMNLLMRLERILISYTSASAIGWKSPASASGGNFSYRRDTYRKLGGIVHSHVASGDDDLMAQAIARNGWDVGYAQGADAIVEHLRLPHLKQHLNATIRHQSTTRYYPARWRIIYALSIVSTLGLFTVLIGSLFSPVLLPYVLMAFAARCAIEGMAVTEFCRRYQINFSLFDLLVAEVLLPLYLLMRTVLSLFPSFSWHSRSHRTGSAAPTSVA